MVVYTFLGRETGTSWWSQKRHHPRGNDTFPVRTLIKSSPTCDHVTVTTAYPTLHAFLPIPSHMHSRELTGPVGKDKGTQDNGKCGLRMHNTEITHLLLE